MGASCDTRRVAERKGQAYERATCQSKEERVMAYEIKPGDVAIVLSPVIEDGEWNGNIKTGMVFGSAGSEDGMRAALDEALTMSAAQKFLEIYPDAWEDFSDIRSDIMQAMFPDEFHEAEVELEELQEVSVEGNVYTLGRWTKTEGSA